MTRSGGGGGHAGHMPSSGRGMAISAWLTGVYFFIEMGIGLWTGSIACQSALKFDPLSASNIDPFVLSRPGAA